MKPLRLVFTPASTGLAAHLRGCHRSAFGRIGMGLLAIAMALVPWTVWQAHVALQRQGAAQEALDAARLRAGLAAEPRRTTPPRERAAWVALAAQLNTPWRALLDTLEASTPDDVALVAIEPDAGRGRVRIVAEAATLDPLLAYAARLRETPLTDDMRLVRHEANDRPPTPSVRLHLELRLRSKIGSVP